MVETQTAPAGTAPAAGRQKQISMSGPKAVEMAGKLFAQGRYQQAVDLCRQIIKNHPNNGDAYNIMGVSLNALGQSQEGVAMLREAIKRMPGNAIFHANLGEIERQRRHPVEARQSLMKAVQLDPKQASAHNNLGILHFERREYRLAVASYLKAVEANPRFAEAYNNLANASRFVGEHDKALGYYHKALQFREQYPEAYNNLGTLLRDQGKLPEAEHAYRKAMMQNPKYMEAYNNLANLMFVQNRDADALRVLSDALRIDENHPATLTITARVQLRRSNFPAAEQAARRAIAAAPESADAMVALGQVFHETDRYDQAVEILTKAVEAAPNSPEARNFFGVALKSVGRLEDGKEQILKAIELNSNNYGSYANLNDLIDFKERPDLVEKMEEIYKSRNPDDPRLMALNFGFAKALDDIGQHERALSFYIKGATQKRAQLTYNEEETTKFFNEIKETFNAEQFKNRPFQGLPNNRLVFIIGMPRSGSTLVEQILSSHPDVYGAGEVKYLARAIGQMRDRFPSIPKFPELYKGMEAFHFEMLGRSYLSQILPTVGSAKKVTDKLLTNYFFAGLINLIFPNAKFVHTRRNPVDTCLSGFTKLFKDDMPHSYDFGELGRYYLAYKSLMDHWHQVLPAGTIIDVDYEEVVADVEGNARRLVDFVGLDWDPACVEFHKSSRPVKTASVAQVRRLVYTASVERWRKYGPGLQPLIDALGYVPKDQPAKKSEPAKAKKAEPAAEAASANAKQAEPAKAKAAEPAKAKTAESAKSTKAADATVAKKAEPAAAKKAAKKA
ncbi:MAG TPA: sulfotransferase [Allosphingosinicella sp.]|nr:sulfotransferase [Allosphingosinicella sp.]